jgi:hypothetical protein
MWESIAIPCAGSDDHHLGTVEALIIAAAHMFVLNDVFAWFIVPLIAVGRF